MGLQVLAQLRLGHPIGVRQDALDGPELSEEIGRGFGADAGHAGDVVAGVARQGEEVAHLARRNPELLAYLARSVHPVSHRVPQDDAVVAVVDELHQVLVGADDDHPPALGQRPRRHRGDEIVGLEAFSRETRDVPGAHDLLDARHLLRQIRRRRRARRLVPHVDGVAERRPAGVHRHDEEVRPALGHDLLQHVHRPEHGVGRLSSRAREGRKRVVRPEDVPRQVDEIEDVACARLRQTRRGCSQGGGPAWTPPPPTGPSPAREARRGACRGFRRARHRQVVSRRGETRLMLGRHSLDGTGPPV